MMSFGKKPNIYQFKSEIIRLHSKGLIKWELYFGQEDRIENLG